MRTRTLPGIWILVAVAAGLTLSLLYPPWSVPVGRGFYERAGHGPLSGPRDARLRQLDSACEDAEAAKATVQEYTSALTRFEESGEAAVAREREAAERRAAEARGEFIIGSDIPYTSSGLGSLQESARQKERECEAGIAQLKVRA